MIKLTEVDLQRGAKFLMQGASLSIHPGEKWGLIGANGSGKTSLFKLLLGNLHEDGGRLSIPSSWRIAHMAQEVHGSAATALDYVLDGDEEYRQLESQIANSEHLDGESLAKLFEEFEHVDGYTAPSRAESLLNGLGFAANDGSKLVTNFSGGWRIRLNLAQALMCRSDLLLLDEPTNHLDLDATLWLEKWLQQYNGTLVIISHDRDFLDNVIQHIVNLEQQKLISYSGNYSAFERQRAERLAQQQQAFEKQQERVAEIEDFVRRFRAKASKAKQAQSRLKELERMETIAPAHVASPFNFKFPLAEKLPQTLMNLSQVNIGYQQTLVEKIDFNVLGNSRIGLLGHNGAGKSTLIKTLAGELPSLAGETHSSPHLRIGYFAQHQLEALDLNASPALHLQRLDEIAVTNGTKSSVGSEQQIRNFLGSFDFQGQRAFETIEHFSGGEKARLALSLVAWQKPNLLLLDEPTNHLDLEVCHALTMALQAYEGAIVVVSHDRHLLKNTVDEFLLVDSGKVTPFDGDLSDYEKWLLGNKKSQAKTATENSASSKKNSKSSDLKPDKKEQRKLTAAQREQLKPLRSELKKVEREMEKTNQNLAKLEEKLADSSLYDSDQADTLNQLLKEQGQYKSELNTFEERWLEINEELELAQG